MKWLWAAAYLLCGLVVLGGCGRTPLLVGGDAGRGGDAGPVEDGGMSRPDAVVIGVCGDENVDEGELCDDGNTTPCDGCSSQCLPETCGNRIIDCGELCDDGNRVEGDGCSPDCNSVSLRCGDGRLDPGEQCDDGNVDACDGCSRSCVEESCGNRVLDCEEECDDGNLRAGDGCSPECRTELTGCGDGRRQEGEECDDGNNLPCDGCSPTCGAEACGNGLLDCVEECDDGNLRDRDGCSASCRIESVQCGDGILQDGEQCDDGNGLTCDGCSPVCRLESCGNGVLDCREECDDGNEADGDGCSSDCRIERIEPPQCGDGDVGDDEECDDGNETSCDGCSSMCRRESCGNGTTECAEECDDGNGQNGDGCSSTCAIEVKVCGNGVVEEGEQCDRGPLNEDRPALQFFQPGVAPQPIDPVQRFTPATFFYGLVSASAHTGFEQLGVSNIFVYRDMTSGVVSLFLVHGIDFSTTGLLQPTSLVAMDLSGVPAGATLALSDDRNEFRRVTASRFVGDWFFRANTDGGIISDLTLPGDWAIRVQAGFLEGITDWRWVNENSFFTSLDKTSELVIQAFPTPSSCRTDCTVPRCGDGVLDGGEACDDGNTQNGDRCSADCSSVL